jgi:hypothetical protein
LLAFRPDRLTPIRLQLSQSFGNPMQPMLHFDPFAHLVAGFALVWGHGPEDAQHQPAL